MQMEDDTWGRTIEIHCYTKSIFIMAEESACDKFKTYLQPIAEFSYSHDHLIRAAVSEIGKGQHANDKPYQESCRRAALNHEIRAFFDSADWLGVLWRKGIREMLEPYSHECIRECLKKYFSEDKPRLTVISGTIAECRRNKDSSSKTNLPDSIERYHKMMKELENIYKKVVDALPALEEFHEKEQLAQATAEEKEHTKTTSDRRFATQSQLIIGLVILAIGGLFGAIINSLIAE